MINKTALIPSYPWHNENRILTTNGQNDSNLPFVELRKTLSLEGISLITLDLVDDYRLLDLIIVLRHESNIDKTFNVLSKNNKAKILLYKFFLGKLIFDNLKRLTLIYFISINKKFN